MTVRIGITGTHCSGKSTLLNDLHEDFPSVPVITGVADRYPRADRNNMETQLNICLDQIQAEKLARARIDDDGSVGGFISDRTVIDNLAYSYMCRDANMRGKDSFAACAIYQQIKETVMSYVWTNPYDLVIFVDEYFPIEDNETRCISKSAQKFVYEFINRFVTDWKEATIEKGRVCPVIRVKGSREERVEMVKKYVRTVKQN